MMTTTTSAADSSGGTKNPNGSGTTDTQGSSWCSLSLVFRAFFIVMLLVSGGLTYYIYDWQKFTVETLLDQQKIRAFAAVARSFEFSRSLETSVVNDVTSFMAILDAINQNVSDPYSVIDRLPSPLRTSLVPQGLSPSAFINQRVNYFFNDSSSPRGYLAAGCNLRTSGFPAYTTTFGCSTNASLTTGSYTSSLYQLSPGTAPIVIPLPYNPDGIIDRDALLARTNLAVAPVRANNVTTIFFTYYLVDYPTQDVMRIRDHVLTTTTWNEEFLRNRGDTEYTHNFVLLITADQRIVASDYLPYIMWQAECEAQYAQEVGKDPIDCALVPLANLPDTLLSDIAFRAANLALSAPAYVETISLADAVVTSTVKLDAGDGQETYVLGYANGPVGIKLVSVVYANNAEKRDVYMYVILWVPLTLVMIGFGLILHWVFLLPISRYASAMEDITKLDLDAVDEKLSGEHFYLHFHELRKLNAHFTTMNKSMAMFTAYVPKEVVKDMMIADTMGSREMDIRQLTVMFADIEGFTTICESVDNVDLSPVLDAYFGTLSRILLSHACTIDKFIGDAIMGFWGAPLMHRYQAFSACCASLHMQHAISTTLAPHFEKIGFALVVRIGCHMGYASVGNIGCAERMSYTALGDTVNIASRLEGMNKRYGTRVLVSQSIAFDDDVQNFVFRQLEGVILKGRTVPMQTFELVGINGKHKVNPLVTDRTTTTAESLHSPTTPPSSLHQGGNGGDNDGTTTPSSQALPPLHALSTFTPILHRRPTNKITKTISMTSKGKYQSIINNNNTTGSGSIHTTSSTKAIGGGGASGNNNSTLINNNGSIVLSASSIHSDQFNLGGEDLLLHDDRDFFGTSSYPPPLQHRRESCGNNNMTADLADILAAAEEDDSPHHLRQLSRGSHSMASESGGDIPMASLLHHSLNTKQLLMRSVVDTGLSSSQQLLQQQYGLTDKVAEMSLKEELASVGRQHVLSDRVVLAIQRLNDATVESETASTSTELTTAATTLATVLVENATEFASLQIVTDVIQRRIDTLHRMATARGDSTPSSPGTTPTTILPHNHHELVFVADTK